MALPPHLEMVLSAPRVDQPAPLSGSTCTQGWIYLHLWVDLLSSKGGSSHTLTETLVRSWWIYFHPEEDLLIGRSKGVPGRGTPSQSISFIFMQFLTRTLPNNRFSGAGTPSGKSWIHHCYLHPGVDLRRDGGSNNV